MDELGKLRIRGKVLKKSLEPKERENAVKEPKQNEPIYITMEEAKKLVEEEAKKQLVEVQEKIRKMEEDTAGRTDFAHDKIDQEPNEKSIPPSYDPDKSEVVVTARTIVDKGNYLNIYRLGTLISQVADLIVGEYSDMQSVVAEHTGKMLKEYTAHLNEFVSRL